MAKISTKEEFIGKLTLERRKVTSRELVDLIDEMVAREHYHVARFAELEAELAGLKAVAIEGREPMPAKRVGGSRGRSA